MLWAQVRALANDRCPVHARRRSFSGSEGVDQRFQSCLQLGVEQSVLQRDLSGQLSHKRCALVNS